MARATRATATATVTAAIADSDHILVKFNEAWALRNNAAETAKTASANVASVKDQIWRDMAATAHTGNWAPDAIQAAAEKIVVGFNGTALAKDTLKNWAGEVRRVCQPAVREHIGNLFDRANAAWEADAKIMNKAHKKRIFYVAHLMGCIEKGTPLPIDTASAIETAKARLTDDAQQQDDAKLIAGIVARLETLKKRYPANGLIAAYNALQPVTAGTLAVAATAKKNGAAAAQQLAQTPITKELTPTATPVTIKAPKPAPAPETAPAAPGLTQDQIEALLGGFGVPVQLAALVARR